MLSIISMNRAGLSDGCLSVKVDFEFDNASTLPERVVTVSGMSYIIAKDSTAKNTVTNVNYKYTGSKWVKVTETVEPVTGGTITDNGDYTITSNEYTGLSDISVNVAGGGGETFEVILSSPDYIEWTADKNYAETLSAIENGDNVKFKVDIDVTVFDSPGYYLFTDDSNPENAKIIMVSLGSGYESSLMITMFVKWTSNDVITGVSLMEMSE